MKIVHLKPRPSYSAKDILAQLNQCAAEFTFPMLDNGYIYLTTTRLSTYRDRRRWAMIIEVVGFNYRGGGHNGINNCLFVYGNCLNYPPGTRNENFLRITSDSEQASTFDQEYWCYLNPEASHFFIRDQKLPIIQNLQYYRQKDIELSEAPKITAWEFLRGLLPDYRSSLLATEEEIRQRIPADLPLFIQLEEWGHPDIAGEEIPSESETFIQIAKALETGELNCYQPTKAPNTHWTNWPESGAL